MAQFKLEIKLGNEAMQTTADVARALTVAAERIDAREDFHVGIVWDENGNSVGSWTVTR